MLHKLFEKAGLHLQFYFVDHTDVIGFFPSQILVKFVTTVTNELVLQRLEDRNILCTIKRRMSIWVGHTLHKNCLLNTL
jgi:hypothetical protein